MYTKKIIPRCQCPICQFFGGAGFSTNVARRKSVVQLARLAVKAEMEEGAVYLPQRGSGVKPRKILAILHFELLKTSLSWLCDNERWRKLTTKINAFESLGSRVWNLTPVCRLQNSSGYGTVCTTQSRPPTFKKRQIYDLKQFSKNF